MRMKIRIKEIKHGEKIVHNKKFVNVGDVIDIPKKSAEYFIALGNAEAVKETPKEKIENE